MSEQPGPSSSLIVAPRYAAAAMPWRSDRELRVRLWRAFDSRTSAWEEVLGPVALRIFSEQAQRARRAVAALLRERPAATLADIEPLLRAALDSRQAQDQLLRGVANVLGRIFKAEGTLAQQLAERVRPRSFAQRAAGDGFSWQAAALQHLKIRENRIRGISHNRFEQIRRTIARAMLGESEGGSAAIASALRQGFGFDRGRALRIARTEAGSAANGAAIAGFQAGGANGKGWLATDDSRTRDSHRELDGEVVPIGSVFSNGLRFPGDPQGEAEEVINCRCSILPEFLEAA